MASALLIVYSLAWALLALPSNSNRKSELRIHKRLHPQFQATSSASLALSFMSAMRGPPQHQGKPGDPFEDSVKDFKLIDHGITRACSASYGADMLTGLQNTVHQVCVPQPVSQNVLVSSVQGPMTDAKSPSSVVCHERTHFDTLARYMCELKNVKISQDGTSAEGCEISDWAANAAANDKFGVTEKHVFGVTEKHLHLHDIVQRTPLDCHDSVARKALVQFPWDMNNFYEWYGDWVTLWETLAALQWNPKDLELFLVTESPREKWKPFDGAWELAFQGSPVHIGSKKELFGSGKCFSHVATVPHGGVSTESFQGGRDGQVQCPSPTMMASALYLQSLAHVEALTRQPTVTLLMRKGNRGFDNDKTTQDALLEAIPKGWKLSVYRPEDIHSLSEQLAVAAGTDVLVGMHGAGMTHVLFLPPRARVVEVFCGDRGSENHHFRNLEAMGNETASKSMSSYYFPSSTGSCTVDTGVVVEAIRAFEKDNMALAASTPSLRGVIDSKAHAVP